MIFVQMEDSEPQTNLDSINSDLTLWVKLGKRGAFFAIFEVLTKFSNIFLVVEIIIMPQNHGFPIIQVVYKSYLG